MTTKAKTRLSKSDRLPDVFCQPTSVPLDSRAGYILISDPAVRRLKLRITKTGAKSWVHVGPRSYTIGFLSDWPYAVVREEAHRLNRLVDQGLDPHGERVAQHGAPTVAELVERWHQDIDSKVPPKVRPSTLKEYTGQINQWILPQLGKKRVTDVTKEDIEALHTLITKTGKKRGTPSRANRVLSLTSALFNFGVSKKICAENPARGIEKNREQPRNRFLSDDEFDRLVAAIEGARYPHARRALKLHLLTGARRGEVLGMQWDHVDLGAGTWRKPPPSVKQDRWHIVPLSDPAKAILAEIRAEVDARAARTCKPSSRWVFPALGRKDEPVREIKATWANVLKRAGIKDFHLHDLRHQYASYLASTGSGLPIIGQLLGHSQARTTQRYAQIALAAARAETDRFAARVAAANGRLDDTSAEIAEVSRGARQRAG
jgi:integrase